MKDRKYLYDGKVYCDTDLSEKIDNYGGDIWDLHYELWMNDKIGECQYYYLENNCETYYDNYEDCIEDNLDSLGIEVIEDEDNIKT